MSCWQFIDQERTSYAVELLCRMLQVSASRYYAWRKQQQPTPAQPTAANWEEALKEAFGQHKRCYGTRRLRVELQAQGHCVGRQRLRSAMRRHGLRALQPRAYTPRTTDSTHGLRCAPNRLLDQPKPTTPNRVWVSDITYLPLASGQWAYLCAFQDACTRQVVGWRVLDTMPEELVTSALRQALLARRPAPGLVVHSDRGGQYCANTYRALLDQYGCQRSQSRRAECLDNAQAESLWSRLKTEELGPREWPVFRDLADAQHSVATYFDYYNHERRHSALAYQTPQTFYLQQLKNTALFSTL
ncbi:IS3 family transposase [Hymenobacter sp. DG01]|uniref:IS3 family transposase n=1 Tax=Hymenobacter sp. DG01 TaxID=2584940 RepID=UPI00111FCB50|nr:IS3 family transposase [Hymenobacter sp. DG01]